MILARLNQSDSYGYEIVQSIKKDSGGRFHIPEGAMYPTLYRLLGSEFLTDYQPGNKAHPLRVYYRITPAGRSYLNALTKAYFDACAGCEDCLASMTRTASEKT